MTATSATSAARGPDDAAVMSIGEVLNLLRSEFADVTISKLRFLEAEGLVEPMRTPAGYRKYTPAHVARLRLVLAAQRDRYLPLRVIREQIEAMERGQRVVGLDVQTASAVDDRSAPSKPPSGPRTEPDSEPRSETRSALGEARLTRAQLCERSGLDEAGIADLEQYGLLVPNDSGHYGPDALTVARIANQLAEYGLEGRHLRPYKGTADREVGLLAQLVVPLSRQAGPNGRAQALETVHELAALCAQLHGALVRQGLREVVGG